MRKEEEMNYPPKIFSGDVNDMETSSSKNYSAIVEHENRPKSFSQIEIAKNVRKKLFAR